MEGYNLKVSLYDNFQPRCNLCGTTKNRMAKCEHTDYDSELTQIIYVCENCHEKIVNVFRDIGLRNG